MRRFLGEDASQAGADELAEKLEEASVAREFEVGVLAEAIARAFGGGK